MGGRVRISQKTGVNSLINGELSHLFLDILKIPAGEELEYGLQFRDYAAILISGQAECRLDDGTEYNLGNRPNPFHHKPSTLMFSGGGALRIRAGSDSLIALGSSPVKNGCPVQMIAPEDVRENLRGQDNWSRRVRLVCWSDNTTAERLMVGETITPSGNWSTMPPHRHDRYREESGNILEVPYQEVYFYQFSRSSGFGMNRQFNDEGSDNALSLISGDALYIDGGYHPVVCAPGADMYQLTLMAGPYRQSTAEVHPDYQYLLGDNGRNPFRNQEKA